MLSTFLAQVDRWVAESISSGSASFSTLLASLPGVDPSVVVASLRRLHHAQPLSRQTIEHLLKESSRPLATCRYADDLLPVPHPLDYEWRFETQASQALIDLCVTHSCSDDLIVLLGAPSLTKVVAGQPYHRRWILYDGSDAIIRLLAEHQPTFPAVKFDVTKDSVESLGASVVVADPPWYPEYFKLFLWSASRMLRQDGVVLLSFPPVGTRPGIELERSTVVEWAEQLGFRWAAYEAAALPYTTPPFEQNAFRTLGISGVPSLWRYGDLMVFQRHQVRGVERTPVIPAVQCWMELTIAGVRIKVREPFEATFKDPTLQSIVPGDVLASVSRRDPRRQLPSVWTSGNRVFACSGPGVLQSVLHALQEDASVSKMVARKLGRCLTRYEHPLVEQATQQVHELVELERNEYLSCVEA